MRGGKGEEISRETITATFLDHLLSSRYHTQVLRLREVG